MVEGKTDTLISVGKFPTWIIQLKYKSELEYSTQLSLLDTIF